MHGIDMFPSEALNLQYKDLNQGPILIKFVETLFILILCGLLWFLLVLEKVVM